MTALVDLRGASAGYGGHAVLHDIDLRIDAGERIAIMGRSGAGKSTLLNLLYEHIGDRVALIPQAAALVRTLSVFHNVYMGRLDKYPAWRNLRTLVWPDRRDVADVGEVLDLVGLADQMFAQAGALSGGQQQRTSVARALYNGRPVVIGDEPVSALDRVQGAEILHKLTTRHETLVLALHDVSFALSHTDRIVVLEHGRIVLDTPSHALTVADLIPYYGG